MLEKFEELQISEPILRALNDMGFEEPTPIQKEAIPVAMSGLDMIGRLRPVPVKLPLSVFLHWNRLMKIFVPYRF